jgi:ferredoxin--NADP+ reductase
VWDPETGRVIPGRFVAGWARQASTGLVGIARHDGELCADKVIEFVRSIPDCITLENPQLPAWLNARGLRSVTKLDLELLARAEVREAQERHLSFHRFAEDEAMFQAIEEERERIRAFCRLYYHLAPTA